MIPRKKLSLTRADTGSYVKGKWVEAGHKSINFFSTVQPATGRDLEILPEARRSSDSYVLITDFELRTVTVDRKTNPDIVRLFDEQYEVAHVKRWTNNVRPNYWALVTKVPQ